MLSYYVRLQSLLLKSSMRGYMKVGGRIAREAEDGGRGGRQEILYI